MSKKKRILPPIPQDPRIRYFDTHSHLHDPQFEEDRLDVLAKADEVGVDRILFPSANIEDTKQAYEAALGVQLLRHKGRMNLPRTYASLGVHPQEAKSWEGEASYEAYKTIASGPDAGAGEPVILAVGEIGLDYHEPEPPRDLQKEVFRAQLALADELDLPVIIHMRDATEDTLEILKPHIAQGGLKKRGVIHCYSGSWESAKIFLDLGFYLGLDGPLTYKKAQKPVEVAQNIPLDRLVLETDSPYLTPEPWRGKRNDSQYLPLIAWRAASVRGVIDGQEEAKSQEEIRALNPDEVEAYLAFCEAIYQNSLKLYGLEDEEA